MSMSDGSYESVVESLRHRHRSVEQEQDESAAEIIQAQARSIAALEDTVRSLNAAIELQRQIIALKADENEQLKKVVFG